ncbi:MAG: phenylacetate--CoA ligase family protein [Dehalogenimonas sp.]
MRAVVFSLLSRISGRDASSELGVCETITSKEELCAHQERALTNLIISAYNHVPYYHRVFDEVQLVKQGQVYLNRFSSVPLLTKDLIMANWDDFRSRDTTLGKTHYDRTGGSTGQPITLIHDLRYLRWCEASFLYWYKNFLGIDEIRAKKFLFWGSPQDLMPTWKARVADWARNTIPINTHVINQEILSGCIHRINKHKPELIRGYAESLYELSKFALDHSMPINSPRAVVSSAEMLTEEMRAAIERAFGQKVFDFYGSREISTLAGQCSKGLYHILGFHNLIELLNQSNQQVKIGETGKVVVTNLYNYSMPLIRYDIGDLATLGPDICQCGSFLPTITKINGRTREHFSKEDGTLISPYVFRLPLISFKWIGDFQIIQEDYKRIRIKIVPRGKVVLRDQRDFERKIRSLMGKDCIVNWETVNEIPVTPQGKRLRTFTMIDKAQRLNNNSVTNR